MWISPGKSQGLWPLVKGHFCWYVFTTCSESDPSNVFSQVDASQGVQAQSISVFHNAKERGLTIIPILNKVSPSPFRFLPGQHFALLSDRSTGCPTRESSRPSPINVRIGYLRNVICVGQDRERHRRCTRSHYQTNTSTSCSARRTAESISLRLIVSILVFKSEPNRLY